MDFEFSEEQKMFRDAFRDFVEKEISPLVEEYEKKEKFPKQILKKMAALGYLGVDYPEEYGGAGLGKVGGCISIEEIARVAVGISAGIIIGTENSIMSIYNHGSDYLKQKYMVPSLKGEKLGAFGLTEPDAGSDAANIQTTAVLKGDHYVLNGTKMFITNAPVAEFVLVAASTDKSKGPRGISLFVLDTDTPGYTCRSLEKVCFRSSETGELSFEDCKVPKENLVGEEGKGFRYIVEALAGGRVIHAARSVDLAVGAFEASLKYSQERVQFGQPIYKNQAIAFKLARMATNIEAARLMAYKAAWLMDQGNDAVKEASMAKLFASEVAVEVANEAMQIHGGYAFTMDSPVQRFFRDSRLFTVTEGTSEIQQLVISRELGLR
ncbi:MAG: acyl-CoA dehydrogenase family protein [Dehalococcoidia bacterium]|nr:acyl-CoA dehydrogenase family protein [Dehalococcoidia bacterium]